MKLHIMSSFLCKTLNNRLNKEELIYGYDESNNSVNIFHKDNIYTMCVTDYPFKPPKNFKVNNQSINYIIPTRKYGIFLNNFYNIKCLCCESILCSNNWNLTFKFAQIIDEYNDINELILFAEIYYKLNESNFFIKIPDEIKSYIFKFLGNNLSKKISKIKC